MKREKSSIVYLRREEMERRKHYVNISSNQSIRG
jgi:hypothetical protein